MANEQEYPRELVNLIHQPNENFDEKIAQITTWLTAQSRAVRQAFDGNRILTQIYRSPRLNRTQRLSVARLLIHNNISIKSPYEGILPSALCHAIGNGDAESAAFLLKHNADPNEVVWCQPWPPKAPEDKVPMVIFSEVCGGTETTKLLLQHGATINARASDGRSIVPYHFRAKFPGWNYERMKERVKLFCKFGYDLNQKEGPGGATTNDHIIYRLSSEFATESFEGYQKIKKDWDKFSQKIQKQRPHRGGHQGPDNLARG